MLKMDTLNKIQAKLLKRKILQLGGEVNTEMVQYVHECVFRLRAMGSPDIEIYITSHGGLVDVGLDIYDFLRLYPGKKRGIVYGYAKSMAAVILQACDLRQCAKHADILIHHISSERVSLDVLREREKLEQVISDSERKQERIYDILIKRTGNSKEKIIEICKLDKSMSPEKALENGLIDEII